MKLLIISPQHQESHIVEWVEVQTPKGSLVIQSGHAPLIVTTIAHSTLHFLLKTGEFKNIYLERPGFLEINRTSITALINQTK